MRFDLKKSFGYPVLRKFSDDYIYSNIEIAVVLSQVFESQNEFNLEYNLSIDVGEIVNGIRTKQLAVVINCFCPKTLFSSTIISFDMVGEKLIDMREVRGDIKIEAEIIVNVDEYLLNSSKFHPEFESEIFKVRKGQVIAQCWPERIFIEREVFKSVASLFQWSTNDDIADGEWSLVVSPSTVKVQTNQKQRNTLINATNSKDGRAVLLNSIFFPALVQLLNYAIAGEYDENDTWFRVIEMKLNEINVKITKNSDPIELAQLLFKKPLSALNQTIFKED